ncbi:MAG TPA: SPFH domain-containing protein [Candidatus Angelobacter sp.]|nr:SPFH domain-containing protein [Candidatus Angelobacter sp.]
MAYIKVPPTKYVIHYSQGKIKKEGAGLSFFYFVPSSTIVTVPFASADAPFVFQEVTREFQPITVQGQLTYRVADPKKLSSLLDFSVDKGGRYRSEDPEKLNARLVAQTQVLARSITQKMTLSEALTRSREIGVEVLAGLKSSEALTALGIEVLAVSILSVKASPEMSKALEAEAREDLQRRSDEAIYARRNAAVEQERRIKESELNTEIAVEEKQREIRETKMAADLAMEEKQQQVREARMAADIAVEQQRGTLLERRTANDRSESDTRAYGLEAMVKPLRGLDWKTLMMLTEGGSDPKRIIAMAFQGLAENAQKIGELNISPDLLQSLLKGTK